MLNYGCDHIREGYYEDSYQSKPIMNEVEFAAKDIKKYNEVPIISKIKHSSPPKVYK